MGLLDLYAAQADRSAPNPLQAAPRTLGERVEATAAETFAPDRYFRLEGARRDMWQRSTDDLYQATGERFANPLDPPTPDELFKDGVAVPLPEIRQNRQNQIINAARMARAAGNDALFDPENIDRYIAEEATRRRERAGSYVGTGNGVGNFLASTILETATPHGVVGLAIPVTRLPSAAASSIGRTFLANVGREAAFQATANAGLQAIAEALDAASRGEVGTAPTLGESLINVAGAGAFGGLIGGGVRALHLKWLGLPESVRAQAPLEVRDAFRVIEADALYSGQNRLGVDPMLHERYQGNAMDAVMRADSDEGYFVALKRAGYATDPDYAPKLSSILRTVKGYTARMERVEVDAPKGYEVKPDGNIVNPNPKDSTIIKDANRGAVSASTLAAVGAASPIVTAFAGMDWRLAAVIGGIMIAGGGLLLWYSLSIRRTRLDMARQGIV